MNTLAQPLKMFNETVTDPVYHFCKQNDIEVGWDIDKWKSESWNNIFLNGYLVLQVKHGITTKQFINLVNHLMDNFDIPYIDEPGDDYWFVAMDEKKFRDFYNKNQHIFNEDNNSRE